MSVLKHIQQPIQRYSLLLAFAIVAFLNIEYLNTYAINVGAFDYPNYANMIYSGVSNLIHASGYAWLTRGALDIAGIANGPDIYDTEWLKNLQYIHVYFHLLAIAFCTFICNRVFGKTSAFLMCLAWGGSLFFMGGVNSVAPDWLQGDLVAISLLTALWAFNIKHSGKVFLYVLSAVVLTLAYLVKFNSLVIAPVIALLIICDSKKWHWKALTTAVSLLASWILVFAFIESFHYPTTNTRQLSYDHAWVLIDAIPNNYITQEPEKLGINALRWKALGAVLPPDYFRAAAYQDVDWGAPQDVRDYFLAQFNYLMNAPRADLIEFVKNYPLPKNFNIHFSAIPGYYYIGLPQTDALGIAVYKESLLAIPGAYAEKLFSGTINFLTGSATQLTPLKSNSLGLILGEEIQGDGSISLTPPKGRIPQHMLYWNPSEKANLQGMTLFGWINALTPPAWFYALLSLASCLAIINIHTMQKIFQAGIVVLAIGLLVSSSLMLLGVRFKEMLALLPVVSIFLGFGTASCIAYYRNRIKVKDTLDVNGAPT
ncbi:hypothetical protein [Pseudomonas sp. PB106]|uniref:hypothetical protein n=1 Tax=Pseudomonas sp. PB106 TaxID=2494699 RepID=UPI00131D0C4F|nr:hypothetical protein [Pseudomonas sp. PB106]KAE9643777.1 hypothetical protein EJA71_15590 [Pseudomonas sp. PB106]